MSWEGATIEDIERIEAEDPEKAQAIRKAYKACLMSLEMKELGERLIMPQIQISHEGEEEAVITDQIN